MTTRVLLTGAGGFTGSHMLRHLLVNTDWEIICPVTFRHRGNGDRISSALVGNDEWHKRVTIDMVDLTAPIPATTVTRWGAIDYILNIASESHVDRSITDPVPFVRNNVDLILNLLEYARLVEPKLFLQMSTDEVYGPAPVGYDCIEWDPIIPSNPYSASKAAQEAIAVSYWRSYGVPLLITNTMNLFGEMQDTEKYFAKIVHHVMNDEEVPVHVSPDGEAGSRFYIHARNFADAWLFLIRHYMGDETKAVSEILPSYDNGDDTPARFNIVGDREVTNLELAQIIADEIGKPLRWTPVNFHSSRPGHDLRYALDGGKMSALGWESPLTFEESVHDTVNWIMKHPEWS